MSLQMALHLSVDSSFTYGSDTAKYYGYIGVRDPQYKERFEQQTVSFMDKNTVIEKYLQIWKHWH